MSTGGTTVGSPAPGARSARCSCSGVLVVCRLSMMILLPSAVDRDLVRPRLGGIRQLDAQYPVPIGRLGLVLGQSLVQLDGAHEIPGCTLPAVMALRGHVPLRLSLSLDGHLVAGGGHVEGLSIDAGKQCLDHRVIGCPADGDRRKLEIAEAECRRTIEQPA